MKKLLMLVVASLTMTLPALPAAAQEAPGEGMVEGVFRVTVDGELPEDYSIYVESGVILPGGVICTTDAVMVNEGYTECVDNGATNELVFFAPEGASVDYRILGSQGVALSQEVIAEGTTTAKTDGLTIDARHTFANEAPADPQPAEEPDAAEEADAADDQYSDETPASDDSSTPDDSSAPDAVSSASVDSETAPIADGYTSKVAELHGGVLPDTGGASIALVAGAALLLAASGFLAYRIAS